MKNKKLNKIGGTCLEHMLRNGRRKNKFFKEKKCHETEEERIHKTENERKKKD